MNPALYLIKYDGFDCVYGLELYKDERVQGLEVLPDRLGKNSIIDLGPEHHKPWMFEQYAVHFLFDSSID